MLEHSLNFNEEYGALPAVNPFFIYFKCVHWENFFPQQVDFEADGEIFVVNILDQQQGISKK